MGDQLPGRAVIDYGPTRSYGSTDTSNYLKPLSELLGSLYTMADSSRVTTHRIALAGLNSGTNYHYRVSSTDLYGEKRVSSDHTFSTISDAQIALGSVQASRNPSTGQITVTFVLTNTGNGSANQLELDHASLGNAILSTVLPWKLGALAATSRVPVTLTFSNPSTTSVRLSLAGKMTGGQFRLTHLVILP